MPWWMKQQLLQAAHVRHVTTDEPTGTSHELDPATDPPHDEPDDDKLGEGGMKALKAEREAHKAATAHIKELEAKLKAYEDRDKSEAEKTAERLAKLEEDSKTGTAKAMRYEIALDKGLPKALAERLQGSTREELEADADELLKLVGEQKPASPKPDPSQGHGGAGAKPTSMEAAIAAALGAK